MEWHPTSREDFLLAQYLDDHPGALFLELPVGGSSGFAGARRIDGVLVPDQQKIVHPQGSYSIEHAMESFKGKRVHLLEAKHVLNRGVIGQVLVGVRLLKREVESIDIVPVAVCGAGNSDLEWCCREDGIDVALFDLPAVDEVSAQEEQGSRERIDMRNPPDAARQRAFLAGWTDAANGTLYSSVRKSRTHMNMGNLFGWIYGHQPRSVRLAVWEHYKAHAYSPVDEGSGDHD